ncbi:Na+/H+ antiporter [Bradyrhizobium sp. LM3.4]
MPSSPSWTLEPDLALALFVAPVLLDAAFDTSLRDLRNNWVPVSTLVVAAVGLTTAGVAYVAHRLMPDIPWAAAVALGAIVAPPDAAAAVAILSQVKLPYRMVKVLEGESLLNDATALLIYRIAVGAIATEHLAWSQVAPTMALALVGSVVAGLVAGRIIPLFMERVKEAPSAIIVQFATTFMVWIAAEHLGLSGILTIVVYAITIARTAGARMPARLRVPSYAVWETMVFVLNVLAFMLIGMQMRPIWTRLNADVRWEYCVAAAWILLTVVLVRLAWITFYRTTLRALIAHGVYHPKDPKQVASPKGGLIVSWCGMRGLVTLATAFALPENFPYRDFIVFSAFAVVLGTLVVQGLTLRPLILAFDLKDDDPVGIEVARARAVAYRAALDAIEDDPSEEAEILRLEYRAILMQTDDDPNGGVANGELPADPLRRRGIAAARKSIFDLRATEVIGDDAFHRIEEELDRAELSAGGLNPVAPDIRPACTGGQGLEPNPASSDSFQMTTLIDDRRVRARDASPARYFYLHMALACAATAFLGFAPTYFVPLAQRTLSASPVIHFHGLLFFTWSLYFVIQAWLAASGRVLNHRAIGIAGVSLATAMTIFGFLASVHVMQHSAALGQKEAGIAFSIVPMSGIAFFAVVFMLAIMNTRKPEIHKRLMLLAAVSILDAAIARWFLTFLAPPGPPGPPPVPVTIAPAVVASLLLVVAMVRDWRTEGRVHPVYIYGTLAMLAVKVLNWPISETAAWHSFAGGILALAQ